MEEVNRAELEGYALYQKSPLSRLAVGGRWKVIPEGHAVPAGYKLRVCPVTG